MFHGRVMVTWVVTPPNLWPCHQHINTWPSQFTKFKPFMFKVKTKHLILQMKIKHQRFYSILIIDETFVYLYEPILRFLTREAKEMLCKWKNVFSRVFIEDQNFSWLKAIRKSRRNHHFEIWFRCPSEVVNKN